MLRRTLPFVVTASVALSLALPAVAAAFYGAIAIDPTYPQVPAYGFSFHFATKSAAEHKALTECRAHATTGTCRVFLWVRKRCGAVVDSPRFANGYGPYVGGFGASKAAAIANARSRAGDSSAKLVTWTCSG